MVFKFIKKNSEYVTKQCQLKTVDVTYIPKKNLEKSMSNAGGGGEGGKG